MIDVSEIVNDPDVASPFQILRTTGKFVFGGWQSNPSVTIAAFGAVRNTAGKELEMVPEGDRNKEMLTFRSATQMFETNASGSEISDELLFLGNKFRVMAVKDYSQQGYYLAVATRVRGD